MTRRRKQKQGQGIEHKNRCKRRHCRRPCLQRNRQSLPPQIEVSTETKVILGFHPYLRKSGQCPMPQITATVNQNPDLPPPTAGRFIQTALPQTIAGEFWMPCGWRGEKFPILKARISPLGQAENHAGQYNQKTQTKTMAL